MTAAEISEAVNRVLLAGPLLYIGLRMAMDAAGVVKGLGNLEHALRRFERRLRGDYAPDGFDAVHCSGSEGLCRAVRFSGLAVVAASVVILAGVGIRS